MVGVEGAGAEGGDGDGEWVAWLPLDGVDRAEESEGGAIECVGDVDGGAIDTEDEVGEGDESSEGGEVGFAGKRKESVGGRVGRGEMGEDLGDVGLVAGGGGASEEEGETKSE